MLNNISVRVATASVHVHQSSKGRSQVRHLWLVAMVTIVLFTDAAAVQEDQRTGSEGLVPSSQAVFLSSREFVQ